MWEGEEVGVVYVWVSQGTKWARVEVGVILQISLFAFWLRFVYSSGYRKVSVQCKCKRKTNAECTVNER